MWSQTNPFVARKRRKACPAERQVLMSRAYNTARHSVPGSFDAKRAAGDWFSRLEQETACPCDRRNHCPYERWR